MDSPALFPNCPVVRRAVEIGGLHKAHLLERLSQAGVELNEAGMALFLSDRFVTSPMRTPVRTLEVMVRNLGFPQGATLAELYARAAQLGLQLCPLELGPHLRLQYPDQPEGFVGQPAWSHRAPPGSLTVASEIPAPEDEFPKGFYLRRIQGVLWLRGYRCGPEHVWDPEDHLLFAQP